MQRERIIVIGAGAGGLSAAADLAHRGLDVLVIERADRPGGKIHTVTSLGAEIDAGPTVFTMRDVFDDLFAESGHSFDDYVTLRQADVLARHYWPQAGAAGSPDDAAALDLFADAEESADAIGAFAGLDAARGFRAFNVEARRLHRSLDRTFMRADRPSPPGLAYRIATAPEAGLGDLMRLNPFTPLWRALGRYFPDPRLRQLFGRYATYVGASPFSAPGVLMLIAHVEQTGVWLVDGGMMAIARALEALGKARGATYRYGTGVRRLLMDGLKIAGVELTTGEQISATAVIFNGDPQALASGLLGSHVQARGPKPNPRHRSLSAMTFAFKGTCHGRPLAHHTVAFSRDYRSEFDAIFGQAAMPHEPTVYICASDRQAGPVHGVAAAAAVPERIFCLINAPPRGDDPNYFDDAEIEQCRERTFSHLKRCGLDMTWEPAALTVTTPADFNRRFPATGGALYGPVSHGWMASFRRPGARTKIPGLYLAGGATHPGAGVPMATLSGRQAAQALSADLASMRRFHPVAMPGGMSTASATTDNTR